MMAATPESAPLDSGLWLLICDSSSRRVTAIRGYDDARRAAGEWKQVYKLLHKTDLPAGRVTHVVGMRDVAGLTELIDQLRRKHSPVAAMLAVRQEEGKVLLVAGLSRDLVEQGGDAVQWVRQVAKLVGGGGGGRPDLAQAGGKNADRLPEALATARESLEELLK